MLFCKSTFKSTFVKEIYELKLNEKQKILVVSDNSLLLYDYSYDVFLKIPFLEPILNQNLFLQILDVKMMIKNQRPLLVILSTCGLLVFEYESKTETFISITSAVLNINSEERHKLMYLAVNEE